MIGDPIVEGIYRTREKILVDCGEDLDKLLDRYQLAEKQDLVRLVTKDMLKGHVKTAAEDQC